MERTEMNRIDNGSILAGLGILLFIIGLIVAVFAGAGLTINLIPSEILSRAYAYLIEAAIAIAFMVVDGVLVFIPLKSLKSASHRTRLYG
jgi:membrane-bound ClpP family serine protease